MVSRASSKRISRSMTSVTSRFMYICISSATWSLRLRAVCRRAPASPIFSVRAASTFMWMSSSSVWNWKVPASISARISFRPFSIWATSSWLMIPVLPSICAWAMLPRISSLYSRWSYSMEALNASTRALVSLLNRPPQSFAIISTSLVSSELLPSAAGQTG